jgi:APA family basic amino acid/polyamine antiporter
VAVAALVVLTAVNCRGITRTARVARVLLGVTLTVLAVAVVVILQSPGLSTGRLVGTPPPGATASVYGVLQGAGLLFFAFAGYARIATLGDEVINPQRTIPRAILIALGSAFAIYLTVGVTLLAALGVPALATTDAALFDAARGVATWAGPVTVIGASAASLGSLLALLAGVSRTAHAMARNNDLPRALAAVDARGLPLRAQLIVGCAAAVLAALVGDLTVMIAFSGFGVLLYYGLANASAFTQTRAHRRWPRSLNVVGFLGCLTLAATLPVHGIALAGLVLIAGIGARKLAHRSRKASAPADPR